MQTILLFGGSVATPKGGVNDYLGILPIISPQVILGTMLEVAKLESRGLVDKYFVQVLILQNGRPSEVRHWQVLFGDAASETAYGVVVARTADDAETQSIMVEMPSESAENKQL